MTVFPFSIITPSGEIVTGHVTEVNIHTYDGSLGIMAHHEPMVAACPAGIISICQDGEWMKFKTSRAIVTCDGTTVKVLTAIASVSI